MTTLAGSPALDVEEFLAAHPVLPPLIAEAQRALQPFFPDSPVLLELFQDPEWPDPPKLHLVVVPTTDPQDAYNRYQAFGRAWWYAQAPHFGSQLAIIMDYR